MIRSAEMTIETHIFEEDIAHMFCPNRYAYTACVKLLVLLGLSLLGGKTKHEIEFSCADSVIHFLLSAKHIN